MGLRISTAAERRERSWQRAVSKVERARTGYEQKQQIVFLSQRFPKEVLANHEIYRRLTQGLLIDDLTGQTREALLLLALRRSKDFLNAPESVQALRHLHSHYGPYSHYVVQGFCQQVLQHCYHSLVNGRISFEDFCRSPFIVEMLKIVPNDPMLVMYPDLRKITILDPQASSHEAVIAELVSRYQRIYGLRPLREVEFAADLEVETDPNYDRARELLSKLLPLEVENIFSASPNLKNESIPETAMNLTGL